MSLIDLQPTHNPQRFTLAITSGICVGRPDSQFLFGGAGLAACIAALEAVTGRPAVWATAQYLTYARPGSVLDLDVVVPVMGKYSAQARVTGHVGETEVLTVNAALGARPDDIVHQWATMPEVAGPDDCPPMPDNWHGARDDIHSRLELRVAKGRYGAERAIGGPSLDGHTTLWARLQGGAAIDRVALAMLADFVPSGVGDAIGRLGGGNSLDNTIRFARLVPTEWVLLDIRIHGVASGFSHGSMHLFAQDGTLMASASQSMIVRFDG